MAQHMSTRVFLGMKVPSMVRSVEVCRKRVFAGMCVSKRRKGIGEEKRGNERRYYLVGIRGGLP